MKSPRKRVAIVTGTRAEFGLLRPVIDAVRARRDLELQLIVAGAHFLPPARTVREVQSAHPIAARVPMQVAGKSGRLADAAATARGIAGFAKAFGKLKPDWVVVLGDRIEAFAAASAASIGGIAVAHIHGGDRAEGIADEAMRHAITKLSHLHLAATKLSGERIVRMGEPKQSVHVVGSPAIDGLEEVKPLDDQAFASLGSPRAVMLLHPSGLRPTHERRIARELLTEIQRCLARPVLMLAPNHDPGHEHIMSVIRSFEAKAAWPPPYLVNGRRPPPVKWYVFREHLSRGDFLALLKRLASGGGAGRPRGILAGNSSAGLIEAAALGVPVVNVGPRQDGRERASNVVDVKFRDDIDWGVGPLEMGVLNAMFADPATKDHPYGDGRTGPRIAALLAKTNPHKLGLLRKHNTY